MKTLKNLILPLLLLLSVASPALGQADLTRCPQCLNASRVLTDDTDVAMTCWYVGTGAAGYVTVSAAGDIVFESPDASTADTSLECPVSGGLGGIIDVSDAACDTVTEVLNIVNAPTSNFRCASIASLGTDTPGPSGTGFILAATDQLATGDGYKIKWDTSAVLSSTFLLAPASPYETRFAYQAADVAGQRAPMVQFPYAQTRGLLFGFQEVATFTGAGSFNVYTAEDKYTARTGASGTIGSTFSQTVNTLWSGVPGATTVQKAFGSCDTPATACDPAWGQQGIIGNLDRKLLVRVGAATTFGVLTGSVSGVLLTPSSNPF